NVRFEHCYRLDLDTAKAPSHRHACWRNWLQVYTYAQPRDRIEYARRRVRSLEVGDPDRPVLNLARSRNEPRSYYVSGPAPVNAHAPPPATISAAASQAGRAQASTADAGVLPPAEQCTAECRNTWQDCLSPCSGADAVAKKTCAGCEPDYLTCMRRCLE
ncbi:MAG TPA: hypothetical protein VK524_21595, partial [Polyangiaceae bacterium]|nr:hypothetical protein [Polyangiaceae bacterium]